LDKIKGPQVHDLSIYNDERGSLLHILSSKNHPHFIFGECYGSETKPGVTKAWKRHENISQNLIVISGEIKLVIFDVRKESSSYNRPFVIQLSRENYKLVHIPKGLWYGFKCISEVDAMIINCIDKPYDSLESETEVIENLSFDYEW
tara:strand:+ start:11773 stop:12213 length:441 start_codon:yes stop_codon:yes gene_type:complete